jgi:hypothetical protein
MARCVWALEREEVTKHLCRIQETDARGWLAVTFVLVKHEELTKIVVTLWAIWYARRKAIHDSIFHSLLSTHLFVEKFISELEMVKGPTQQRPVGARTLTNLGWIHPPAGMMKINVDAAISKNMRKSTAAAVARDEAGNFWGLLRW